MTSVHHNVHLFGEAGQISGRGEVSEMTRKGGGCSNFTNPANVDD
jgi:hypothetical protein